MGRLSVTAFAQLNAFSAAAAAGNRQMPDLTFAPIVNAAIQRGNLQLFSEGIITRPLLHAATFPRHPAPALVDHPMLARHRSAVRLLLLLIAGSLAAPAPPAAATDTATGDSWKVGVATTVITPTEPMWMSGYGARNQPADGKLTELWAKAMALEDASGSRSVLVTLDLVGIDRQTTQTIAAKVAQLHQLPRHALAISTSHTHSGPVVGSNLMPMYFLDEQQHQQVTDYTQSLIDRVVQVVGKAIADLQPAQLHWTVGQATFAVNRRNNPEPEVPQRRQEDRLAGPTDHDLPILVVKNPAGDLRLVVCGYACHATVLSGYQWCGDWPGYAQIAIEKRFPNAVAMVWAGCGADQNPLPRREVELAQAYGAAIDRAVAAALDKPLIPIAGALRGNYQEIDLPLAEIPARDHWLAMAHSENRYEASRARHLLTQWDTQGHLDASYPYPIQSWQLGDGPTWVFLGGEVVVDYALRLKQELGAGPTWVAGYCNDVMAYIASRRVLREGGYEGATAMIYYGLPAPWAETIEELIIDEVRQQVAELGGPPADQPRTFQVVSYPDHQDLSVYRDQNQQLQPIESAEDWQQRRKHILLGMQQVMGRLPNDEELPPLSVEQTESVDFNGFQRLTVRYRVDDRQHATAHLYLPTTDQPAADPPAADKQAQPLTADSIRRPAVLALHPTSPLGKAIVAGEGPRPNRNYAQELAQRGYVVLAPDYPSFGDQADYNFDTDRYLSGTMTAIVMHRRGIDLLQQRPEVDPQRIGAIGHSLGGHNAMFLAAWDPRVQVAVSSCGWDPFTDYQGGTLAGWASDRYMPRIRSLFNLDPQLVPFDLTEVAAAIAPRGFFSASPLHDHNFAASAVQRSEPKIRQIYQLLGAADHFIVSYPDADHDFPPETRQQAYEFLDRFLLPPPSH